MNSPEGNRLPHYSNLMIVGLTESPNHTPCVGMTFEGKDWIMLTTRHAPMVSSLRNRLKESFGVDTLEGAPYDWRESLEQKKLVLLQGLGIQSIFVPAERFDELAIALWGL